MSLLLPVVFTDKFSKGNVLVDGTGAAVLCDAKFYLVVFRENEYRFIPSKSWWKAPEQLIADNVADGDRLVPPSQPADVYGAALVIEQVYIAILNSSTLYADPIGHGRRGHYGVLSTTCVTRLNSR
jgi:hypothetical protein